MHTQDKQDKHANIQTSTFKHTHTHTYTYTCTYLRIHTDTCTYTLIHTTHPTNQPHTHAPTHSYTHWDPKRELMNFSKKGRETAGHMKERMKERKTETRHEY